MTTQMLPWQRRERQQHPYFRTGVQFLEFGSDTHMGLLNMMTTDRINQGGVSFRPICIDDHVSFGQRCVTLSGTRIGKNCTIGAETFIPRDFELTAGGTTFGSPPVQFHSSTSNEQRVEQTQRASITMRESITMSDDSEIKPSISRRQDVGKEMYWTYIFVMLTFQALIPVSVGGSYALLYWIATKVFQEISFTHVVLGSPLIYIFGSIILMLVLKFFYSIGGGFSVGTSNFFSLKFLYWHVCADLTYFCTSTVLYPLSGTQMYCIWLRFMGARIGSNVFISPENGGFREIGTNFYPLNFKQTVSIHIYFVVSFLFSTWQTS
jgi:hypothetical protein